MGEDSPSSKTLTDCPWNCMNKPGCRQPIRYQHKQAVNNAKDNYLE